MLCTVSDDEKVDISRAIVDQLDDYVLYSSSLSMDLCVGCIPRVTESWTFNHTIAEILPSHSRAPDCYRDPRIGQSQRLPRSSFLNFR
jgi:hypothetical protein